MCNEIHLKIKAKHATIGNEYTSELTDDMNNHLVESWKSIIEDGYCHGTYLTEFDNNIYSIRVPGATRGHIAVDANNVITNVVFYETTCFSIGLGCYDKSLLSIKDKYIGYKVIVESDNMNRDCDDSKITIINIEN